MDAKLKALKVVDLKDILAKAAVPVPAKATKPDLIAKVLASPAALDLYAQKYSPTPPPPASKPASKPAHPLSTPLAAAAAPSPAPAPPLPVRNDDLLAPPEEVDWNVDDTTPSVDDAPASPPKPKAPAPHPPKAAAAAPSDAVPASAPVSEPAADYDAELAKRKARAARFNIPLVQPAPVPTAVAASTRSRKAQPTTAALLDDPNKLKSRAERFGIPAAPSANGAAPAPAAGAGAPRGRERMRGTKRAAPPAEEVDAEEAERRRKRAERFGGAVAVAAAPAAVMSARSG